jgi:hypothetical protein
VVSFPLAFLPITYTRSSSPPFLYHILVNCTFSLCSFVLIFFYFCSSFICLSLCPGRLFNLLCCFIACPCFCLDSLITSLDNRYFLLFKYVSSLILPCYVISSTSYCADSSSATAAGIVTWTLTPICTIGLLSVPKDPKIIYTKVITSNGAISL